jgi:hypothetical protein
LNFAYALDLNSGEIFRESEDILANIKLRVRKHPRMKGRLREGRLLSDSNSMMFWLVGSMDLRIPPRPRERAPSPQPVGDIDHEEPDHGSKNLCLGSRPRRIRSWLGPSGPGSIHDKLSGGNYCSPASAELSRGEACQ